MKSKIQSQLKHRFDSWIQQVAVSLLGRICDVAWSIWKKNMKYGIGKLFMHESYAFQRKQKYVIINVLQTFHYLQQFR